jgi:hypothetical protein
LNEPTEQSTGAIAPHGKESIMAMTLSEMKVLYPNDPMRQRLISKFLDEGDSVILPELYFVDSSEALGYTFVQADALGDVSERNINAGYTDSDSAEIPKRETLSIFGGSLKTDQILIDAKGDAVRLARIDKRMMAASRYFDDVFFNGNTQANAKQFNGLARRAVLRGRVLYTGANGGALTLDLLDQALDMISGDNSNKRIYCDRWTRRTISALVKGIAGGKGLEESQQQLQNYNGAPIKTLSENQNYAAIFKTNEVRGTANDTRSLYVVRLGKSTDEQFIQGIRGPSFMKLRTPVNMGEYVRDVVDNVLGIVDFDPNCLVRIAGIH